MSAASSETGPETLLNGERRGNVAAVREQISSVRLRDGRSEDSGMTERETLARMQSVFQQVRHQIRSQVCAKAPQSGILELVQKIKERETETLQVSTGAENKDVKAEEETGAGTLEGRSKNNMSLTLEELCAVLDEKLDLSKKALKDEFEAQIVLVRKETRAYTDQALKEMECRLQSCRSNSLETHSQKQPERVAAEKKPNSPAASSVASRRGKVLTRSMTTILPKTCANIAAGRRAKSETLSPWKGQSCQFPLRSHVLCLPENKPCQSRNPAPPGRPRLQGRNKPVQAKSTTGK